MSAIETLVRGWVLVSSSTPRTAAEEILRLRDAWVFYDKVKRYYVVRADVVQVIDGPEVSVQVIVPIFAENETDLHRAVNDIRELRGAGITGVSLAFVTEHHPEKPHETWGYIPSSETNPKPDAGPLAWNGWG